MAGSGAPGAAGRGVPAALLVIGMKGSGGAGGTAPSKEAAFTPEEGPLAFGPMPLTGGFAADGTAPVELVDEGPLELFIFGGNGGASNPPPGATPATKVPSARIDECSLVRFYR